MKRIALGIAMALMAAPASAQDFNWHRESNRVIVDGALNNWADFCTGNFGFTRVPRRPASVMQGRINAQLLLTPSPDAQLREWVDMIRPMRRDSTAAEEERMADAIGAAQADPATYARAERLYVEHGIAAIRSGLDSCAGGARQPFIAENYYSGEGSLRDAEARFRAAFAESVRNLHQSPAERR